MPSIRIDGTAGNDTINEHRYEEEAIYTYGGNDVVNLYVNDDYSGGQYVDTGEGNDIVSQSFNGWGEFYLGNGNDTFVSEGDDGYHVNYIDAGAGNDTLAFDTFNSQFFGGSGNDSFFSTSYSNDMDGGAGVDLVSYELTNNAVTIDLLNDIAGDAGDYSLDERVYNIENARGSNFNDLIQGDNGVNTLEGLAGHDTFWGLGGNDILKGDAGNDSMAGGSGNDTITGGAGVDDMWGEAGADRFVFTALSETGKTAATRDWIGDFVHGSDKIDLSAIDARSTVSGNNSFIWLGSGAFSGVAGQLHTTREGANTVISGDINGDRAADFHIELQGAITLSSVDFLL